MPLQFILQLILPSICLMGLWHSQSKSKLDWLLRVLMLGSFLLFSLVTARWDWFSYYLRILLVPLFRPGQLSRLPQNYPTFDLRHAVEPMEWISRQWYANGRCDLVQRSGAARLLLFT